MIVETLYIIDQLDIWPFGEKDTDVLVSHVMLSQSIRWVLKSLNDDDETSNNLTILHRIH